jgi:hypothetical protein
MTNQQQLTDEQIKMLEKQQHIRSLNNARSKNYYQRHRPDILKKNKLKREQEKKQLDEIAAQLAISTIEDNEPEPQPQPDYDDIPTDDFNDLTNEVITYQTKVKDYTKDDLVKLIKNDNTIQKKQTRDTYVTGIRRVFKITKCTGFKACLNSYKKMIKLIENSNYAINTIKGTIQSIAFVATKYNILHNLFTKKKADDLQKAFVDAFEKYKDKSIIENENKQANIKYPSFTEYLNKLKKIVPTNSKEWLLTKLYQNFTVRDDYKELKIIEKINDDNNEDNFLLYNKKIMLFIMNKFKTNGKYKRIEFTVTGELKKLLNDWISIKNKKYGDYLFEKSSLSKFMGDVNKKLGYNDLGGVGIFRHMRVSEVNPNEPFEVRKKLADQMGHSLLTQKTYRRNLNVI